MTWLGIIQANALHIPLADECIQCAVTSPPYYGLRDYDGIAGQIGMEKTPEEYVGKLRAVFAEVRRVMKPSGTLWLNIGDSYAGSWGSQGRQGHGEMTSRSIVSARQIAQSQRKQSMTGSVGHLNGIKAKDLYGIPWLVAFALRSDGWYLRRDIIWNKPNPMPESVTDRPTSSHEYIFLMSKSSKYFYDADAVAEPAIYAGPNGAQKSPHAQGFGRRTREEEKQRQDKQRGHGRRHEGFNDRYDFANPALTRNRRSVWTISTKPYLEAHYATFPEEIPEICIKAGCRPGDIVLDPFAGSGTVARVAERLNRRWIGLDLGYQELQKKRVTNVQKELQMEV